MKPATVVPTKNSGKVESFEMARRTVGDMLKLARSLASVLARGFRGRWFLELESEEGLEQDFNFLHAARSL